MRIGLTGATGFIGRHVLNLAVSERHEVVALVRSAEAARRVVSGGARPVVVPGFAEPAIAQAVAGCDAVVHLANIGSERGLETYAEVNVGGTRRVARGSAAAGVPRFVYLSGLGVARYGFSRHTTNAYFLSKLRAESAVYASVRDAIVLRPSYVLGPGDGLVTSLLRDATTGGVEIPGDGAYRMQPVAVSDAAGAILAACAAPQGGHRVVDLVGPDPLSYRAFLARFASVGAALRVVPPFAIREIPLSEALRAAGSPGGYRGIPSDELDCLLCDEVADARPLEALLGRFLVPVDDALRAAIRGTR